MKNKCKCGHEEEQHCDNWCSGGENCDCKKFEDGFNEILNRKSTTFNFSLVPNPEKGCEITIEESANISEEDYNKTRLGGRQ